MAVPEEPKFPNAVPNPESARALVAAKPPASEETREVPSRAPPPGPIEPLPNAIPPPPGNPIMPPRRTGPPLCLLNTSTRSPPRRATSTSEPTYSQPSFPCLVRVCSNSVRSLFPSMNLYSQVPAADAGAGGPEPGSHGAIPTPTRLRESEIASWWCSGPRAGRTSSGCGLPRPGGRTGAASHSGWGTPRRIGRAFQPLTFVL